MGRAHAVLSPSGASRWIQCPASVGLIATLPEQEDDGSVYAREGTAAHALGEIKASLAFGKITARKRTSLVKAWRAEYEISDETFAEMTEHTDAYVALLLERAAVYPHTEVFLEQRVDTGVPQSWGTGDAVLVSPTHVEIIDLKYGKGLAVEAEGNSQLRLYGIGALEGFGDLLGEVETVTMTIFQPRLHHTLSETLPAEELRAWRDSIIPIAEEALAGSSTFGPSESACQWCPASGICTAQYDYMMETDFGTDVAAMTPEDIAKVLPRVSEIKKWLAAVEAAALRLAYSEDTPIPGWKVVLSGGRRVIRDPEGALEALAYAGYDFDTVGKKSLRGIGELEKLMKDDFETILSSFIERTPGNPAMVVETDRRESIDRNASAAADFGESL